MASGEALRKTFGSLSQYLNGTTQIRIRAYLIEGMWLDLRELVLHVIGVHGPNLLASGSTKNLDDLHKLIDTGFTREEWLAQHQFCHDTSSRPHIYFPLIRLTLSPKSGYVVITDFCGVVSGTEDQFWRPVVT